VQSSLRRIARAVKFKIFLSLGHNIIAEVHVSFSFSFSLSLSLSLSLYPERTFPRTQRYKKKRSLPLSFSSGSDGFFKSYFDLSWRRCYVMYCHHRHLRGLAGSRACFPRPKNAHSARAISFFLYLFHGKCLAQLCDIESADIFLCNHKHIQSFVNSVLIIAKTLSLSPSLARAFSIEASAKEREKERKRKRDIQY